MSNAPDSTPSAPAPNPAPAPAPAAPAPERKPAKTGKIDRWSIGVTVVVQIAIAFAILVMLNVIGYRDYRRWDFSRNQKYALSNLTKNVLNGLKQRNEKVEAIVFFPQAQILSDDVASLLREYEHTSSKHLTVEYVNPYRNLIRARELAEKYKFGSTDNIVILDYKGKSKFVNAVDMAEFDTTNQMLGQQQPATVKTFKGEEAITSALLELTEEKPNKVYFLTGHGEPEVPGDQLRNLKIFLDRQNIKIGDPLNLNNAAGVPADANAVLIMAPKGDLSEREIKLLNEYWTEKKGRFFIMVAPTAKTPRLNDWLTGLGASPQGDRVLRIATVLQKTESGAEVPRSGLFTSPNAHFLPSGKEVTKDVVGMDIQLYAATQSIKLDQTRAQSLGIRFVPLLESAEGYWGETDAASIDNRQVFFDGTKDNAGPLTLAVALEKGALADQRVKMDTSRLVLIGNGGFVLDDGLQVSAVGIDFALNSLNWVINREQLAGIPPKTKAPIKLTVDEDRMNLLALWVIIVIPVFVGILGVGVTWIRRTF